MLRAGLRIGEARALEWRDVDLAKKTITVARTDYMGHVGTTKADAPGRFPFRRFGGNPQGAPYPDGGGVSKIRAEIVFPTWRDGPYGAALSMNASPSASRRRGCPK